MSTPYDIAPTRDDTNWRDFANCATADPNAFFPDKGGSDTTAKTACGACEVRAKCLRYALDNNERFGIWGGLSRDERRAIRRSEAAS